MRPNLKRIFFGMLILGLILSACSTARQTGEPQPDKLKVLATTTLVADVVRHAGGPTVEVSALLPIGTDPHSFQPTPQDMARIADADLIFSNGAGLETFLEPMIQNAGSQAQVVPVSQGIQLLQSQDVHEAAGESTGGDPHTWFDPNNVLVWTENIQKKLSEVDPAHAQDYARSTQQYQQQLKELDRWISEQVAQVPPDQRLLVSDHVELTYFAKRYGFQELGAVIPGYSTLSEPSAQEIANLEDTIRKTGVKAIFVGKTVNPTLEQRVAQDTGAKIVYLYTGSLSGPDGPAATYLDFMHYDVSAIVSALK